MRSLIALPLVALAASATAYDPIVRERGWEQVDRYQSDRCAGEAGTNGQAYVLAGTGFAPGEPLVLTIANGDMTPILRRVRADGDGAWRDYYLPFRWHRAGGIVEVTLAGEDCAIPLSFAWTRVRSGVEAGPFDNR